MNEAYTLKALKKSLFNYNGIPLGTFTVTNDVLVF